MLVQAHKSKISLNTTEIFSGTSDSTATTGTKSILYTGIEVTQRRRSQKGNDGVVMASAGIQRRSVAAFNMGIPSKAGGRGDDNVAGTWGLAENITSGSTKRTAAATDSTDSNLKERNLEGLVVVIG